MTQHWICSRRTLSLNVTSSDLTTEELLHLAEDMLREDLGNTWRVSTLPYTTAQRSKLRIGYQDIRSWRENHSVFGNSLC